MRRLQKLKKKTRQPKPPEEAPLDPFDELAAAAYAGPSRSTAVKLPLEEDDEEEFDYTTIGEEGDINEICVNDREKFQDFIVGIIEKHALLHPSEDDVLTQNVSPDWLDSVLCTDLAVSCYNTREVCMMIKKLLKYFVRTNSKRFYSDLYGGSDLFGVGASYLEESMNTTLVSYEMAPVFTIIEERVIDQVKSLIGYKTGDGTFVPDTSIANMYAMVLARFHKFPEVMEKGMCALPRLAIFSSTDGHESINKGGNWIGIGLDNIFLVDTDENGRMDVEALETAIKHAQNKKYHPFFVNCTLGTPVLGAFDPLEPIADLCEQYNLWLHVDASYGGCLLLANQYVKRFNSLARSNSFVWAPHKMMGAPLQCTMLLTRHKNLLERCNDVNNPFYGLFPEMPYYDPRFDVGNKSIQSARKPDAFKLFIMWKARGLAGFDKLVKKSMSNVEHFIAKIQSIPNFRPVQEHWDCASVCFWYIPDRLLNKKEDEDWWLQVHENGLLLNDQLMDKDELFTDIMIAYTKLARSPANFFRLIITCHPERDSEDIDSLIGKFNEFKMF